jgi:ribonuclease HI
MSCVTTVRYSVKFNGTLLEAFSPTRGLRQGDPLSPFLFLFVADGLSALLSREVQNNGISPVKVCRRAPGISHLLFADDTLLFFRASEDEALRVKHVIEEYANGTGQLINPNKCSIIFSAACPQDTQEEVRSILQIVNSGFEEKYLGLPTPDGRMHKGRFVNLQSRLCKFLMDWGDSLHSQSAREILIKAIAQAVPTYVMGVFKLPFSVCDDLTKLIRDYWWGVERGKRKTHWVNWNTMMRSKMQGGMGFRDMRLFNQALLARQAWRLLAFPDSLCARVLKARYYPQGELMDTVFTGNPSSSWSAISYGLELLKKGLVWRVGNGERIRIWRDSWLPRHSYGKILTPKGNRRFRRVSELLDGQGNWKTQLVYATFHPIDAEQILKIKPSRIGQSDVMAWQLERSGVFSVRSAYKLAFSELPEQCAYGSSSSQATKDPCWSKIWGSSIPPKVKTFAWRAASNALATEANKLRRQMKVSGYCKICELEVENVAHALCHCPHAKNLWSAMRECWHLPSDADFRETSPTWFRSIIMKIPNSMVDCFLLVAWRAWHARNEVTHDKPLPSIECSKRFLCSYTRTLRDIKVMSTDQVLKGKQPLIYSTPQMRSVSIRKELPAIPWVKPLAGWVKLTIDGSFRSEDGTAGTGMVLRDETGQVIFSACRFINSCAEALEAELLACSEGLELAIQHSQLPIIIDSDCSELVSALKNPSQDRSAFLHTISGIKRLASNDRVCNFVKVDRGQVRVSHCLANWARTERQTLFSFGSGPDVFLQELEQERLVNPIA